MKNVCGPLKPGAALFTSHVHPLAASATTQPKASKSGIARIAEALPRARLGRVFGCWRGWGLRRGGKVERVWFEHDVCEVHFVSAWG